MQDEYGVVWREMSALTTAHEKGEEVEVLVPKGAPHGDVIVRAILWMLENTEEVKIPQTRGTKPSACYEPILPDGVLSTSAEIDPRHIVWITGNTQSRIGVIREQGKALVPGYGMIPLKNFRWVSRDLASSAIIQEQLGDALDEDFETERNANPVEYEPFPSYLSSLSFGNEPWSRTAQEEDRELASLAVSDYDATVLADDLLEETESVATAVAIANMPDLENWYAKRPKVLRVLNSTNIKPVYKHNGPESPLMILTPDEQLEGKRFRFATEEEAKEFASQHKK